MKKEETSIDEPQPRTVRMKQAPEGKKLNDDEKWDYANFTDSFVFSTVLRNNREITKDLINLFVNDLEIKEIRSIRSEERQDAYHYSKTTYLDVEVILSDDTAVLIEMQVQSVRGFVRRMRYYRSEYDVRYLLHGDSYERLPNVIQIVICLFDPVGEGRYIYDYELHDRFTDSVLKENGQRIIFLNSSGFRGDISDEQLDFVKYLRGEEASGNLAKNIDASVSEMKYDETKRAHFMKFEDLLKDTAAEAAAKGKAEGLVEGRAEGLVEGRAEGLAEGIKTATESSIAAVFAMLKAKGMEDEDTVSMLSDSFGKSAEEIREIIQRHPAAETEIRN